MTIRSCFKATIVYKCFFLSACILAFIAQTQNALAESSLQLSDTKVQNQVYTNKDLSNSAIQDIRFDNVSFTNTDFSNSNFDNVTFNNCRFQFTNFASAQFKNVTFVGGDLRQARFHKSTMKNVVFDGGVKMFGVDLSVAKRQNVEMKEVDRKTKLSVSSGDLIQKLSGEGSSVDLYVQFKFDSAEINDESADQVSALAQALRSPNLASATILIEGHTDSAGPAAYNEDLSYRRAASVRKALVENHGVKYERLRIKGYGEAKPLKSNKTAFGRSVNRRVTIVKIK